MSRFCGPWIRISILISIIAVATISCFIFPLDQILNSFLIWIHKHLGPWGPVMLAIVYIPLTLLAVPASILSVGGGYLFGLPVGFLADSIGATLGAIAAFLVGKTVGRAFVVANLENYPQFQAISLAIQRSGFKIVLLLRLAPLLPFSILNYLLSITPVNILEYTFATWIGMLPITFALVYVGTTLKDLSDMKRGFPVFRWVWLTIGFAVSVLLMLLVAKVAKNSLSKAILESRHETTVATAVLPSSKIPSELHEPLIVKVNPDTIE